MIRFFKENDLLATSLNNVDCGRSNSGGNRVSKIDGGGMFVGGDAVVMGGAASVT
jgi:hypothetical protein